ncbi:amylo-alpha-1,6-glucosidase [Myxococcaceae bacterium GXIMD 01537]
MAESPLPVLPLLAFEWPQGPELSEVLEREWLVTNGLGGYASGTLAGCNTRKYHGLLIPGLESLGRTVLMARLGEQAFVAGWRYVLDGEEHAEGGLHADGTRLLRGFTLEGLVPCWDYQLGEARLRRRLTMVHGENTVFLQWQNLEGPPVRLRLRPFPVMRPHHFLTAAPHPEPSVRVEGSRVELRASPKAPSVRLRLDAPSPAHFIAQEETSAAQLYRTERERGYEHTETQWSPGCFECELSAGQSVFLGMTADGWRALEREPSGVFEQELERQRRLLSRAPPEAQEGAAARLVLAADAFIITPLRKVPANTARSIIAGYPWFTDWGRDTMISLPGLALDTGRYEEAAAILRTYLRSVRDGLIPNLFPEGAHEAQYNTADATLWLFNGLNAYLERTGDEALLREEFPTLRGIIEHHLKGTCFQIGVDPVDGLLRQGDPNNALTWMDARVEGWVVTPRRGKAVELNALWYNALRLMADWATRLGEDSAPYRAAAEHAQASFNRRFWNEGTRCLFDVLDGEDGRDDPAVRPNQLLAISLSHPILARERWESVLETVERELLTPVGLRSLAPGSPGYHAQYAGDTRTRDAAYHQGTVWSWLIGPYLDASLKVNPDVRAARSRLSGLEAHLQDAGVGQLSEIFDAAEPHFPRGCIAQAWSVAELLRVFLKTREA